MPSTAVGMHTGEDGDDGDQASASTLMEEMLVLSVEDLLSPGEHVPMDSPTRRRRNDTISNDLRHEKSDENCCSFGVPWGSDIVHPAPGATSPGVNHLTMRNMPQLKRVVCSMSAGANHCAIICTDGQVRMWGKGNDGQLGLGTTESAVKPTVVSFVGTKLTITDKFRNDSQVSIVRNDEIRVVSVSCGYVHTACLVEYIGPLTLRLPAASRSCNHNRNKNAGVETRTLYCMTFGSGLCGALGQGASVSLQKYPHQVLLKYKPPLVDTAEIRNSDGLDGVNLFGDLDASSEEDINEPERFRPLPAKRQSEQSELSQHISFSAIDCGFAHMAAVVAVTDNSIQVQHCYLYTWGWNKRGQLGIGCMENQFIPQIVKGLERFCCSRLSCGFEVTAATTTAGDLFVMGQGLEGQLGLGPDRLQCSFPQRIESMRHNVRRIACGSDHTAALCFDGSLRMWGRSVGYRPKLVGGLPAEVVGRIAMMEDPCNDIEIQTQRSGGGLSAIPSLQHTVTKQDCVALIAGEHSVFVHDKGGSGNVYQWVESDSNVNGKAKEQVVPWNGLHYGVQEDVEDRTSPLSATTVLEFAAGDSWVVFVPNVPVLPLTQLEIPNARSSNGSVDCCITAGSTQSFYVRLHDKHGQPVNIRSGKASEAFHLDFTCIDGNHATSSLQVAEWDCADMDDNMDYKISPKYGCLKGRVFATEAGIWRLSVTYIIQGKHTHVRGSPVNIEVAAGNVCPRKCIWVDERPEAPQKESENNRELDGESTIPWQITAGVSGEFCFQARDKFGNRLSEGGHDLKAKLERRNEGLIDAELCRNGDDDEGERCEAEASNTVSVLDRGDGQYIVSVAMNTAIQSGYTLRMLGSRRQPTKGSAHGPLPTNLNDGFHDIDKASSSLNEGNELEYTSISKHNMRYRRVSLKERRRRRRMRRMNAVRNSGDGRISRPEGPDPLLHSDLVKNTANCVQFGPSIWLNIEPSRGHAQSSRLAKISGVVTVGMRASLMCHVYDIFGNETLRDESEAFEVIMRPLSSHLQKDVCVETSVKWIQHKDKPLTSDGYQIQSSLNNDMLSTKGKLNIYEISYSPTDRGAYSLLIKLHGENVTGSPTYVRVGETNASSLSTVTKKRYKKIRPHTASSTTKSSSLKEGCKAIARSMVSPRTYFENQPENHHSQAASINVMKSRTHDLDSKFQISTSSAEENQTIPNRKQNRGKIGRAKTASRTRPVEKVSTAPRISGSKRKGKNESRKKRKSTTKRPASSLGVSGPLLALCKARNIDTFTMSKTKKRKEKMMIMTKKKKKKKKKKISGNISKYQRPKTSLGIVKSDMIASATAKLETNQNVDKLTCMKEGPRPSMPVIKISSRNSPQGHSNKSGIVEIQPPPSDGKHQRRKTRPSLIDSTNGPRKLIRNRHKITTKKEIDPPKRTSAVKILSPAKYNVIPTQFSYRNINSMEIARGVRGSKLSRG